MFDIEDVQHPVVIDPNVILPNVKAKYDPYFVSFSDLMTAKSK